MPATACTVKASEQAKALGYAADTVYTGLTKREAFAMAAMQGICASSPSVSNEIIAIEAVNLADNLLKQLENNQ